MYDFVEVYYNQLKNSNLYVKDLIAKYGEPTIVKREGRMEGEYLQEYIGSELVWNEETRYPFITGPLAASVMWREPWTITDANGKRKNVILLDKWNVGHAGSVKKDGKPFDGALYKSGYENIKNGTYRRETMNPVIKVVETMTMGNYELMSGKLEITYLDGAKFTVELGDLPYRLARENQ